MNNVPPKAGKSPAPASSNTSGINEFDWTPGKKAPKSTKSSESHHQSASKSGSSAASRKRGVVGRTIFFLLVVALVSVVLPKLSYFTNDIEIVDENSSNEVDYIKAGEESMAATSLQVKLYSLGYLEMSQITGRFDPETLNALNTALESNGVPAGSACSYDNYSLIMGLESSETPVLQNTGEYTDITNPDAGTEPVSTEIPSDPEVVAPEVTTGTTSATTLSNEDTKLNMKVRITAESTKLRDAPSKKGVPIYLLLNGATYMGLNEAQDDEGVTWYRIKYSAGQFGWVISTDVNVYYE